jgi:hypothetical protein
VKTLHLYSQSRFLVTLVFVVFVLLPARADEPILLREQFKPGYEYHVSTRVQLEGSLRIPPEKGASTPQSLPVRGTSAIEYDERILEAQADGQVRKTARLYRRIDFDRTVAGRPQQNTLRPEVRRLVVVRLKNIEVPFSPDGPLKWNEIDLVRTDVFTPALSGLLPTKPARPGDHWNASLSAIRELTDMERIDEGTVESKFDEISLVGGRRQARLSFAGTVQGLNEDGPNRQHIDGYCYFNLESNHLSYLYLNGSSSLLDKDGKTVGKIDGRFVLTREAHRGDSVIAADAWRGLDQEPSAENTMLLHEDPAAGLRFLYPRRWRLGGTRGTQLALDEANGSGVLITVDPPGRGPTGTQFLQEVRSWLDKQKAKILRVDPPRPLTASAGSLEHFSLDVELSGQRLLLDYLVVHQAGGGATLAARLLPAEVKETEADLLRIARSMVLTQPKAAPPSR